MNQQPEYLQRNSFFMPLFRSEVPYGLSADPDWVQATRSTEQSFFGWLPWNGVPARVQRSI